MVYFFVDDTSNLFSIFHAFVSQYIIKHLFQMNNLAKNCIV